eukprot:gene26676-32768_t
MAELDGVSGVQQEDALIWSVTKDDEGNEVVTVRLFFSLQEDMDHYIDQVKCCIEDAFKGPYFQTNGEPNLYEIRMYDAQDNLIGTWQPSSTDLVKESWFLGTVIGCGVLFCICCCMCIGCLTKAPDQPWKIVPESEEEVKRRGMELVQHEIEEEARLKAEAKSRIKSQEEADKKAKADAVMKWPRQSKRRTCSAEAACVHGHLMGRRIMLFNSLVCDVAHYRGIVRNRRERLGSDWDGAVSVAVSYDHIAASYYNTCGIRSDNHRIECWGDDSYNQTSHTPDVAMAAVTVGRYYACGLREEDQEPECWGINERPYY